MILIDFFRRHKHSLKVVLIKTNCYTLTRVYFMQISL